jgi:hypothetical protein
MMGFTLLLCNQKRENISLPQRAKARVIGKSDESASVSAGLVDRDIGYPNA